jgi:hypothetical protein
MKTKLEVTLPGDPDRHFPIDTRAIVGKGPTADVSLDDSPGVVAQHFRIKLGPNDVDVRLAPGARPLTYEGRTFAGGPIPYGADFYLDRIRFSCPKPKAEGSSRTLPLLIACGVVVAGVTALFLVNDGQETTAEENEQEVVLFPEAPPCPQSDANGAARKALSLEKAAEAKRERYRYEFHDGLDAGRLFAQASKCYAVVGDQAGVARVDAAGKAWRELVMGEFRAARLRLRTAIQNNQLEAALAAVVAMQRMLKGENVPYVAWLSLKERQLKLDLARIARDKEKSM